MHTLTILPRESYLRHRWNKDGKCERCGFDGASFMKWMQSDEAKMYPEARFPKCKGEMMMMDFWTMPLDSPEIPEECRQKYRELLGHWPDPGEMEPMAAVWAMAWLTFQQTLAEEIMQAGGNVLKVRGERIQFADGTIVERDLDLIPQRVFDRLREMQANGEKVKQTVILPKEARHG